MIVSNFELSHDRIAPLGVSVIIPCLNEIQTLKAVIEKAFDAIALLAVPGEVIVSDNGSDDGSQTLAESLGALVVHAERRGYGAALCSGIDAARYRYLVMGDADDSYDFREAVTLVELLQQGADLAIGSRLRGTIEPGAMPWKNRHIGTPVLTAIVNIVYGANFSDANSGMRAFTKRASEKMRLESTGMEFASEMLVKASILHLSVREAPITLRKDGRDRPPHLRPWRDGWRHLKFILLFAPKALYAYPAGIMLALASMLATALIVRPGGVPVVVFGFAMNDHWLAVDALLWIVGISIITSGTLLHLYTLTQRLRLRTVAVDKLIRVVTLERIILVALICLACGLQLELGVIDAWRAGGYAILNVIRPAIIGMMLLVTTVQLLTCGFFYAVLVEQYEKIEPSKKFSTNKLPPHASPELNSGT